MTARWWNVNEDGEAYDSHATEAQARLVQADYPADVVVQASSAEEAERLAFPPAVEPVVDTFQRTRLTLDDLRERASLPGGHRDRVVLATSMWSDHLVLTPWRVMSVEDTDVGGVRVWVRLATDPLQSEQMLPLHEQRVYGLAPEGV